MGKRIGLVLGLLVVIVSQVVGIGPAGALETTYTGTLDSTDPTMAVVAISTPNCTAQLTTQVSYDTVPFTDVQTGTHTFTLNSTGTAPGFASLYIMEGEFDPQAAFPNCIAGNNGADPIELTVEFTAGTTYYAVVFDDQFAQPGGDWELVVQSPDPPPTTTTTSTTTTTIAPTTTAAPIAVAAPVAVATPRFTG